MAQLAESDPSPRPAFWTPGLKVVAFAGGFLIFFAGLAFWAVLEVTVCGGDGGVPYAAIASPRGSFCEYGGATIPAWAPFLAFVVGIVFAARRRRRIGILGAFVLALALLFAPLGLAAALPPTCAHGDQLTYDCSHV